MLAYQRAPCLDVHCRRIYVRQHCLSAITRDTERRATCGRRGNTGGRTHLHELLDAGQCDIGVDDVHNLIGEPAHMHGVRLQQTAALRSFHITLLIWHRPFPTPAQNRKLTARSNDASPQDTFPLYKSSIWQDLVLIQGFYTRQNSTVSQAGGPLHQGEDVCLSTEGRGGGGLTS